MGVCVTILLLLSGALALIFRKRRSNQPIMLEINALPEDGGIASHANELNAIYEENDMYGVVGSEENEMYGEVCLEKFGLEENNDMYGIVK
jgi:hypothetical protein